MAKDRKKLQHMHSSIPDKQPTPASLEVGEIAVNNAADQEFLSVRNTNDKVVRFSSDGQVIDWIERKEVMPYVGYVRGAAGPSATSGDTPTADGYGSYGIENADLLNNKSELVFKLNQVAAELTTKHDKVNGKKDMYDKDVNPTTDGGINDGAGFFIDMSRYAMQDANPQFSGITNTCYTNLNGTTKIKGLDDDCGSLLEINVKSGKTDITSALTTIGSATTTISGDTVLRVSGTTTETKKGAVTENNLSTKTENTTGLKTENNGDGYEVNTSGNTKINSTVNVEIKANESIIQEAQFIASDATGTTEGVNFIHADKYVEVKAGDVVSNPIGGSGVDFKLTKDGDLTETITNDSVINIVGENHITSSGNTVIHSESDICETASVNASFYGVTKTNVGLNCDESSSSTTTNVYGKTMNVSASTANTTVGTANIQINSAFTSANTATTVIKVANTSATTATLSGNTLEVTENQTTINSCGKIELTTDNFTVNSCSDSGTSTFNFCNGYTLNSDDVTIEECNGNGTILIKEKGINLSGGTLSSTTTANTIVKVGGNLSAFTTGDTNINTTGNTNIASTNNICEVADKAAAFVGTEKTNIGKNCADGGQTNTLNINGDTINVTGNTISAYTTDKTCVVANTDLNLGGNINTRIGSDCEGNPLSNNVYVSATTLTEIKAPTITLSGNTTNITGATNVNIKGDDICISGGSDASMGANSVRLGTNCDGSTIASGISAFSTNNIIVTSQTINESGTTLNQKFNTINITSSTINQSGDTYNITANTTNNGDLTVTENLYLTLDCTDKLSSTTVNAALCEVLDRSVITMTKTTPAATSEILATYKLYQNGQQVGEDINIPKDHLLKDVNIKYGTVNGSAFTSCSTVSDSCHWYIELIWNVFDPSTGHANDKVTYLLADDFIKDIAADNSKTDRGVDVNVWYDGKQNKISADTTVVIKNNGGSGTKTFTKSDATHTLTAYTLTTANGTHTATTFDPFTGNATINIPTDASHITRKTLKIIHNGLSDTYDPGVSNKDWTLPHSALTIDYGVDVTSKSDDTYDTSAAKTISIPTCVQHLNRDRVKFTYVNTKDGLSEKTYDPGSGCSNSTMTVNVPKSLKALDEWDNGCLVVPGCLRANNVYSTSDERLKENIEGASYEKYVDAHEVDIKQFNFKRDDSKRKTYGVIAQDVEQVGLGELIYTDGNGLMSVDYTSLMLLKIKYLENELNILRHRISQLENKEQ